MMSISLQIARLAVSRAEHCLRLSTLRIRLQRAGSVVRTMYSKALSQALSTC